MILTDIRRRTATKPKIPALNRWMTLARLGWQTNLCSPDTFAILESENHGALLFETFRERPHSGTDRDRNFACFGAGPSGARFRRTVPRLVEALVWSRPRALSNWPHRPAELEGGLYG